MSPIPLVLTLLFAQSVNPELSQLVETGMKAKVAGDFDGAIRAFRRLSELAPELAAAHANLGAVYFEKRDYAESIGPLRRALSLRPDLIGSEAMLGTALLAIGDASASIAHLENAGIGDLLGVALLEVGRPREALDRLEAALLQHPGDPDLLYYLSQAHGRLAKSVFDRLRAQPGGTARAQQMLGEATAAVGQRAEAEKHFAAALASRSDLRGVHFALGELALTGGDYSRAETEFRAEAVRSPAHAATAYKLGLVLMNRGETAQALAELTRAEKLASDMPETLLELGKALVLAGDVVAGEKRFRRVLEVEDGSSLAEAAHLQLMQLYRKTGRGADAERERIALQRLRSRGTR